MCRLFFNYCRFTLTFTEQTMLPKQKNFYLIQLVTDTVLLIISFYFAAVFAQSLKLLLERSHMFVLVFVQIITWYFATRSLYFYDDIQRRDSSFHITNIIKLSVAIVGVSVIFVFLVKENFFTRNFIFFNAFFITTGVTIRILTFQRFFESLREKGIGVRNLMIIGAGETGRHFLEIIQATPTLGYTFKGFLDDNPGDVPEGYNLGTLSDLDKAIEKNEIDEVVLALPMYAGDKLKEIIRSCNKYAVRAYIIPDYFKVLARKFRVSMLGNYPIISVRNEPLEEFHWRLLKRLFDISFSFVVFILLLSWVFPLIAILQKLLNPGPVFFIQDRVGKDGSIFRCYKFRSMRYQAKEEGKFKPAIHGDSRVTRFGRILRKLNIDELPQFINVLLGDMSVVGPRPHAVKYNEAYSEFYEEIKLRNLVKPGLTGWAQMHGLRGDVENEEENKKRIRQRIDFDIWYVENWSFRLDIQIILMTVWLVLKGESKGV